MTSTNVLSAPILIAGYAAMHAAAMSVDTRDIIIAPS
jgi:hypothetical protein